MPRDARPPAPPYAGEGPFALFHLSEDPAIEVFVPRPAGPEGPDHPVVWAIDTRHAPIYWFPRDCPRGCVWVGPDTTEADRLEMFATTAATRIHVVEAVWLERIRACRLYAYELPPEGFEPHPVGGYHVARHAVEPVARHDVGDLLGRHAAAGFELRVTPSIWPFWRRVAASTLEFSGCRLRNAAPHPLAMAMGSEPVGRST